MLYIDFFLGVTTEYVQNVCGYCTEYVIINTLLNKTYYIIYLK
jgi:hypothetical protein